MVDRNWTSRVTAAAASTAHARLVGAVDWGATVARDVAGHVGDAVSAVPDLVTRIEGPTLPLREPWGIGLGQVLSGHPALPESLRGVVGRLDHFGRLQISPTAINFDGDTVRWEKVEEVRFASVLEVITSRALDHEAARLASLLPPVPGRGWLVRQAVGILVALCLAVAGPERDDDVAVDGGPADDGAVGIPVSLTYRGLARRKELTPGVFAALVAAATPSISEAIAAVARERGITVTVASVTRARQQALALRRMAGAVSSRFGRPDEPLPIEGPDGLDDPEGGPVEGHHALEGPDACERPDDGPVE